MKLNLLDTNLLVSILKEVTDYATTSGLENAYPIFNFPEGFEDTPRSLGEILEKGKLDYAYGFIIQRITGHVGLTNARLYSHYAPHSRAFVNDICNLYGTLRSRIDYTTVTDEETFIKLVLPVLYLWQMLECIDLDTIFSTDNKFEPEDI